MMEPKATGRRVFLQAVGGTAAALPLLSNELFGARRADPAGTTDMTVQDVIDRIIKDVPGGRRTDTVDVVKCGDPGQKVKGIVTTFMANYEVIRKAADLGANLIITHEPTFYNHRDEVDWLTADPVYLAKKRLLDDNQIVVWRFHDYWHATRPDGIVTGLLKKLDWESKVQPDSAGRLQTGCICTIAATSLKDLALLLKRKLDSSAVRFVGNPSQECRTIGILPGAYGGQPQISFFGRENIDVMICGEIAEWETSEYVRDAVSAGMAKGLVIVGHQPSEEPGMKWLVEWLKSRVPDVKTTHVSAGSPFNYV